MINQSVFVVRAEYGKYTDAFRKGAYAGIGWFEDNPASVNLSDREHIKKHYKNVFPDHSFMKMNQNVGQIHRFINEIGKGSIVVCPFDNGNLLVGRVEGDLYYARDSTSPYEYRKKVNWFKEIIDRHELSVPLQNTLRSSLTCYQIQFPDEILARLGLIKDSTATAPSTTAVSPTELIRKRFLQLEAGEFELLVSYVLRSLGFEPRQETGKVGDGGIDFEGVLDVYGVASIDLQVQVKRYDKGAIGEKEIRNFRGALKKGYKGCFITLSSFNKKAKESATDSEREPIQLIDGPRFIEIFVEQYDKIMVAIEEDESKELAGKLNFKKSLIPI